MRALLVFTLTTAIAISPLRARAQEEEEEENSSFEQSTEDSSDETTAESTNEPSRNTTDPTVEVLEPTLGGGREPSESEGDHTDADRAAAIGISALSLALVIVGIVAIAAGGGDKDGPTPVPAIAPHEKRAAMWLGENDEQLRIDLARGEGPTLEDLAAAFAVRKERRDLFAAAMRRKRGRLIAALDASVPERARVHGFLREVSETMRADGELRSDWEAWRMTYGVAAP